MKRMKADSMTLIPLSASTTEPGSIPALITAGQESLGYTDLELANALGYEKGVVVQLMKQGSMRLPINKVHALASALELEPADVLRLSLAEHSPEMLAVIENAFNPLKLTQAERGLVMHLRDLAGDRNVQPMVFQGGVVALVTA